MTNQVKEKLQEVKTEYNPSKREGKTAKEIEDVTSRIPSDTYLWASIGAMTASLALKLAGKNSTALFIGQWAAPFLLFGLYNKIVKVAGSE